MSYLDPNIVTSKVGTPVFVSPQGGMAYPVHAPADPSGKILTGAATLLQLPSGTYSAAFPQATTFSTYYITNVAYDATVSNFVNGTNPTITFLFDRQGADGVWYPILPALGQSGAATLAAGTTTVSLDIGLLAQSISGGGATSIYGAAHNVFTPVSRVRWQFGGTAAATQAVFSVSVIGR